MSGAHSPCVTSAAKPKAVSSPPGDIHGHPAPSRRPIHGYLVSSPSGDQCTGTRCQADDQYTATRCQACDQYTAPRCQARLSEQIRVLPFQQRAYYNIRCRLPRQAFSHSRAGSSTTSFSTPPPAPGTSHHIKRCRFRPLPRREFSRKRADERVPR